jgi:Rieske Fe-S protein
VDSKPSNAEITRRRFLSYIIGSIGLVIGVAVASPLIGYFTSPVWKKGKPQLTPIARTSDIPIEEPTLFTYEQRIRDGWYISTLSKGVWVVKNDAKEFTVFDPRCTHLNYPYYWDRQRGLFQCPCHEGWFDIDGNVLHGPPPRPLDRLEFTVEGGIILITSKIIRGEQA